MAKERFHIKTPIFQSALLSNQWNKEVYFKMDCYQPSGSFKIRGIGELCEAYFLKGYNHFLSSSGGNAGYSVAYIARELGAEATVIVPHTTHSEVMDKISALGAYVEVVGDAWDDTHLYAMAKAESLKAAYIHPFDDPLLWKGNASIIDECTTQISRPDAVVAAVGGGGLLCGVMRGMEKYGWGDSRLIAAETEGAASFAASYQVGSLVTLERVDTIATSLAAKTIAEEALQWAKKQNVSPYVVTDKMALDACSSFLSEFRVLVEPACGAALSAVYNNAEVLQDAKSVLVLVCGGIAMSLPMLEAYKEKVG